VAIIGAIRSAKPPSDFFLKVIVKKALRMPSETGIFLIFIGLPLATVTTFVCTIAFARRAWLRRDQMNSQRSLFIALIAAAALVTLHLSFGPLLWEVVRMMWHLAKAY
jgi:hypothetical protein